jgi:hypothetical protein
VRWSVALVLLAGCDKVFLTGSSPDATIVADADERTPECPIAFGAKRYLAITQSLTWGAAQAACAELSGVRRYSHLAIVSTPAEAAQMPIVTNNKDSWVGLTDVKDMMTFRWITTEPTLEMPWIASQPDDPSRMQGNCGRVLADGSGLADGPCTTDMRPAVCECDEFPVDPQRF